MRLLGAVLVVCAFGGAGMAAVGELERRVRLLRDMELVTERMHTEVCLRLAPLPAVLRTMAKEWPRYFAGAESTADRLADVPFAELWSACVRRIGLPSEPETAMIRLGAALSEGEPPERAFAGCQAELARMRNRENERKEKNARLYLSAGLAFGCLVVIVLV